MRAIAHPPLRLLMECVAGRNRTSFLALLEELARSAVVLCPRAAGFLFTFLTIMDIPDARSSRFLRR